MFYKRMWIKNNYKRRKKWRKSKFFSARTNESLLTWSSAIVGIGKKPKLTKKDKICDLHFVESDILKDYITKLPDGSVHKTKQVNNHRRIIRRRIIHCPTKPITFR
ncbi:uncharacterized protein LOC127281675 [Leptopilina boulardi]|uniref:uncharacterized protein LOC127281675 n=1 Tax=Leptopilina boulardi TaxID=63433 RepID=UPI0021F5D88F|nr:uncharacterized protein LOC127281675 [Leptopilina boulardi]